MTTFRTICVLMLLQPWIAEPALGNTHTSSMMRWAGPSNVSQVDVEQNDRPLNAQQLLAAALQAGGVDDATMRARCWKKLKAFCDEGVASDAACGPSNSLAQAAYWFDKLQRGLLTGRYEKDCYRVDKSLAGGSYNCVTSTILYVCVCRQAGIHVQAVTRLHHVYCRVWTPNPCDVQTTCADWFEHLLAMRQAVESKYPEIDESVRVLSDQQLIAKVLYNRASALAEDGRFAQAISLLRQACRLDPADGPAHQNLVAAWNNWALQLCDARCFPQAAEKILCGLRIAPHNHSLLANDLHIHHQWVLTLCAQHRYDDALDVLEQCHRRRPEAELFDRGRRWVYDQWAAWLAAHDQNLNAVHSRVPDSRTLTRRQSNALPDGQQSQHGGTLRSG